MTAEDLAALHALSFVTPRPWSAAEFASLLAGTGALLVTEPQGFALGRALAGEAELLTIAVAPAARRQGAGTRLIAAFLESARAMGATTTFLEVAEGNSAALGLYRRSGFAEAGRRPGYYLMPDGGRMDAILLRRFAATEDR